MEDRAVFLHVLVPVCVRTCVCMSGLQVPTSRPGCLQSLKPVASALMTELSPQLQDMLLGPPGQRHHVPKLHKNRNKFTVGRRAWEEREKGLERREWGRQATDLCRGTLGRAGRAEGV